MLCSMSKRGDCYERVACPWGTTRRWSPGTTASRSRPFTVNASLPAKRPSPRCLSTSKSITIGSACTQRSGICRPRRSRHAKRLNRVSGESGQDHSAGKTKWNYWGLLNLAVEGITSFTTAPLRLSTFVGITTATCAISYGTYMIVRTLVYGSPVVGYPSLIVIMLFLGGIQLMAIGVVGEYVGRIFNETKRRPIYFKNAHFPRAGREIVKDATKQ